MLVAELSTKLEQANQQHLLNWWKELSTAQQERFTMQLAEVDFDLISRLLKKNTSFESLSSAEIAQKAVAPRNMFRLADLAKNQEETLSAETRGRKMLQAGKVGVVLVAGGQGTRLGFEHPKGMFPVGPVTDRTLFQIMFEQVLARSKQAGAKIPYFLMTSDATDTETREYLQENNFFGLDESDVFFFKQGTMPAVDANSGKLLLSEKAALSVSPDGHGGMLSALTNSGVFDELERRGIETLYYHQVDNPTAVICDPLFLGLHAAHESEMSTKVVAKVAAEEKMGVVVDADGVTQIIEYSDMPEAVSQKVDDSGNLIHWAGSTAIHAFDVAFLKRIAESAEGLPFHVAHKKVPFLNEQGELISPAEPNAFKFERFIFDAMPLAKNALVLEAAREHEFNPVKNATGSDSPETSRTALNNIAAEWLTTAGADVSSDATIELSPLYAVEPSQLKDKIKPNQQFSGNVILK